MKNINSIKSFLDLLDTVEVSYVSWKNNHELDESLAGKKDLDIFIPENSKAKFINLAKEHGWIEVENRVAKFESIKHFYKLADNAIIFHIHVYFKIITGESWIKEFDLPFEDFLMESKIKCSTNHIWILNNKTQTYLFLVRHFLKTGSISSRTLYKKEIISYKQEWEQCSRDEDIFKIKSYGPLKLDSFIEKSGLISDFSMPSYFTSLKVRSLFYRYLRINRQMLVMHRAKSFFKRLLNKLIFQRKKYISSIGLVVAISGADGAGKSSIIKKLEGDLSPFLSCEVFTLGKPQGLFLEKIRLFFDLKSHKNKTVLLQKNTNLKKALLAIFLSILRLRMSKKAIKKSKHGSLIIVDRWPTSSLGKMDSPKIFISNKSSRLLKWLSTKEMDIYKNMPYADICIYLNVSLETAISRNEEREKIGKETREEIINRHSENQGIKPLAKKTIQFNNDGDFIINLNRIKQLIVSEIIQNQD